MDFLVLPKELTLESINLAFRSLAEFVVKGKEKQDNENFEMRKEVNKNSFSEVVKTISENAVTKQSNMMYLDIYNVHGILRSINDSIIVKLQEVEDNIKKQETCTENLLTKVSQMFRLLQKKYEKLEEKLEGLKKYTKNHFVQTFKKNKKKQVFDAWKKYLSNKIRAKELLKVSLKRISKYPLSYSLSVWKQKVTLIQTSKQKISMFESEKSSLLTTSSMIQDQFFSIKHK